MQQRSGPTQTLQTTHMDPQGAHRGAGPGAHEGTTLSRALAEADDGVWLQGQRAHVLCQAFVPDKTCERYLLEDCATTLHNASWLPVLVMESHKLAHAIMKRGMNQGLSREHTLALVVYTADLRQFGASDEQNLYHGINIALLNAEDTAGGGQIQKMTRGYLHFFSRALALLPREQEGWTYRGIACEAFASSETHYHQGAIIQWKGIVSTSKDKQVAMNFSGEASCGTKGVLIRIWTSSGVSIENFSWFGKRESEVVLGPDVFFVVSRALYTDPDGLEMIDLVQLPEEGARCDTRVVGSCKNAAARGRPRRSSIDAGLDACSPLPSNPPRARRRVVST
jgi:hypothetical protein